MVQAEQFCTGASPTRDNPRYCPWMHVSRVASLFGISYLARMFDEDLLAAGVSAITGVTVVHPDRGAHLPKLSIDNLFHATYIPMPLESGMDEKDVFEIHVKTLTVANKNYTIQVTNESTIAHVKASLEQMADTPGKDLRLVFSGKLLNDEETIKSAGIVPGSSLILWFDVKAAGCEFKLDVNGLAPKFDYDFTKRQSDKTYMRGKFEYHRPYGWYRYGLNVIGKYDDDKWLGPDGIRTDTSPDEWPVSYHGTKMENAKNIAKEGYSLVSPRDSCTVRGSTPPQTHQWLKSIPSSLSIKVTLTILSCKTVLTLTSWKW